MTSIPRCCRGGFLLTLASVLLVSSARGADSVPVRTADTKRPAAPSSLPPALPDAPATTPTAVAPRMHADAILTARLSGGQVLQPIDLASALKLGGARDLDIAIARQRVCEAVAELEHARALWLPSLFLGPTWYRLDGKVQAIDGKVINADRSSLFIGGLATGANSYPATPPGSGFPPLTGLSTVLRFSDAIYEPMSARRGLGASHARLHAQINDALLEVAEAYFDLQQAIGQLEIAAEAAGHAKALADISGSYARSGLGTDADSFRALTEHRHRLQQVEMETGRFQVASANLVRVLVLEPRCVVAPIEPPETLVRLVSDDVPVDQLIVEGLHKRPELAAAQEVVEATLIRLKQARLRPLIPSLAFSYSAGGFGGGTNSFFGNFGSRGDATVSLFWEVQNLGFTDRAIAHRNAATNQAAILELVKTENRVAADIVSAYETRAAAIRCLDIASQALVNAKQSLDLNFANIRKAAGLPGATRPIEVLQPIQALAQARADYIESVVTYNRSQFRLVRAVGQAPGPVAQSAGSSVPVSEVVPSPGWGGRR